MHRPDRLLSVALLPFAPVVLVALVAGPARGGEGAWQQVNADGDLARIIVTGHTTFGDEGEHTQHFPVDTRRGSKLRQPAGAAVAGQELE